MSVPGEQNCPNGTDITAPASDTLHTSAEHRDPGSSLSCPMKSNLEHFSGFHGIEGKSVL